MLKFLQSAVISTIFAGFSTAAHAAGWIAVGQHYHTTTDVAFSHDPTHHDPSESYSRAGIEQLLARGAGQGLDAMIVTEHNSVAPCFDPIFADYTSKVSLICGEEWTTRRSLHLGILNPPVTREADNFIPRNPDKKRPLADVEADARELIKDIHHRSTTLGLPSLVVVNHPGYASYQPTNSLGADAVEVLVPGYERPAAARMWWLKRLAAGDRMVALGSSDYHACSGWDCIKRGDIFRTIFSEPINLVLADSAASNDVIAAIARGRVVVLATPKHKDIRIEFEAYYNGRVYLMGDLIPGVRPGETVRLDVRVRNARGLNAAVFGLPFDVIREIKLDTDDFASSFVFTRGQIRQAIHLELFDPSEYGGRRKALPVALSNPIYF